MPTVPSPSPPDTPVVEKKDDPIAEGAETILLQVGDPDLDWATHTSLIVPFAYRIERLPHVHERHQTAFWEPMDPIVEKALAGRNDTTTATPHPDKEAPPGGISKFVSASERRKYFTSDTAYVLFGRSQRYRLRDPHRQTELTVTVGKHPGSKKVTLKLSPPELWLFEAEQGLYASSSGAPSADDPLCCGQLRQEFHIMPGSEPFTLADLLRINEQLRFLRNLYAGDDTRPIKLPSPGAQRIDFWLELLRTPLRPCGSATGEPWLQLLPDEQLDAIEAHWETDGALIESWQPGRGNHKASGVNHGFALVHDDDRAYVWSTAIIEQSDAEKAVARPEESAAWAAFLNVDDSPQDSSEFMRDWVKTHTYRRWAHYGTLYGFTTYSGVLMAKPSGPPAWQHMRTLYLDQTRLLLYLRSVIFSFSTRLVSLSAQLRRCGVRSTAERRRLRDEAQILLDAMSKFVNLYQFPLLSNQQQGLELYALQREQLDIDELFSEVRREAEDTHRLLSSWHAQEQQAFADLVQRIGLPIAVIGVTSSILALKFMEAPLVALAVWLTSQGTWGLSVILPTAVLVLLGLGVSALLRWWCGRSGD